MSRTDPTRKSEPTKNVSSAEVGNPGPEEVRTSNLELKEIGMEGDENFHALILQ